MSIEIQEGVSLKQHCTFKLGGQAKFFCVVKQLEDLQQALKWASLNSQKIYILGGGSNVLFSDQGFNGLVIKIGNEQVFFDKQEESENTRTIVCQAGVGLSRLVGTSVENALGGLDWAAGIPGTVGGAIRGNAGAFEGEMKDQVTKVVAIDSKIGQAKNFNNKDCQFQYRSSIFKTQPKWIIWEASFKLPKAFEKVSLKEKVSQNIAKRNQKHPNLAQFPSAGSVFKNPQVSEKVIALFEEDKEVKCKGDKVPAGWLIERCGLTGKRIGDAMVSPKQANFIVNMGEACASDVLMLISIIKQKVRNQFGAQLQEEIEVVF